MRKPTVSLVLGGGHSIGVPLAVSAQTSFIAPSAAMTIHPVRLNGLVIGVPQTFHYFDRIQERIIQFVTKNSAVQRETFTRLMLQTGELAADVGSVIYGEEAVRIGLIDRTGGLSVALDCIQAMMDAEKNGGRRGSTDTRPCSRRRASRKIGHMACPFRKQALRPAAASRARPPCGGGAPGR